MKKKDIRELAEAHLLRVGFGHGTWRWNDITAELHVIVDGRFAHMTLKSGMSRRAFEYAMGRISGWSDMLRLAPRAPRPNGVAHEEPHQLALPIMAGA